MQGGKWVPGRPDTLSDKHYLSRDGETLIRISLNEGVSGVR